MFTKDEFDILSLRSSSIYCRYVPIRYEINPSFAEQTYRVRKHISSLYISPLARYTNHIENPVRDLSRCVFSVKDNTLNAAFLFCALPVRQRRYVHILLKDFMEVIRIAEAYLLGYISHRHLSRYEKLHSKVYTHSVYVIYRGLTYRLLKHLRKVVRRDANHIGKLLDIYLIGEVFGYII